jgi:hypothetical protein
MDVQFHTLLPQHWMEVSGQPNALAFLPSGERVSSTYCAGGWVDLSAVLDTAVKRKMLEA